jgi:hypothetical protein
MSFDKVTLRIPTRGNLQTESVVERRQTANIGSS